MRFPIRRTAVTAALLAALPAATVLLADPFANASSPGWITICSYSHSLTDDPIVHPMMTGMSHLHDFMGNKSTSATSTYASMAAAGTTCGTAADTAGYWAPALYRNGVQVKPSGYSLSGEPTRNTFYYRADDLDTSYHITAFPADFRVVAGNAMATSAADNPYLGHEIYWGCSDNSEPGKLTAPMNCSTGVISLHIGFPNCWDGVVTHTNDTPHVVYPDSYKCPSGYPIALPRLIIRLEYPVGPSSSGITLASGPTYTAHGDFWNTWEQSGLQSLVDNCLNKHLDCGNNPTPAPTTTSPTPTSSPSATSSPTASSSPSMSMSPTSSTSPTSSPTSSSSTTPSSSTTSSSSPTSSIPLCSPAPST